MKKSIFGFTAVIVLLLGYTTCVWSQTAYVSEVVQITLRRGPGADYKVITMLSSGQQIDVLNTEGNWAQVQLPDGKQGWVLSRFVTIKEPCALLLNKLQTQIDSTNRTDASLAQQNQDLNEKLNALQAVLFERQSALKKIQKSHAQLESDAKLYPATKNALDKSRQELAAAKKNLAAIQNKDTQKLFSYEVKWFLMGAGVFAVGLLIGLIAKGRRRKSTLLT
jgi:SH3 domain protein